MLDFENSESVMGREGNHTVQRSPLNESWRLIDMDIQGSHVRSREEPWTQICGERTGLYSGGCRVTHGEVFIVFRDGAVTGVSSRDAA